MKTKSLFSVLILLAFSCMYSCKDIIEVNLAKKSMTGLVPADSAVSASSSQAFRWDLLDGALKYQIQIAKPNFTAPLMYLLDTTIAKNTFSITLSPGVYQWRARALNGSSHTDYVTNNLRIDSTLNMQNQTVILSTPLNNTYANNLIKFFSWQALPNATSYIFEIDTSNILVDTKIISQASLTYTFTAQGTYSWHVRGQNSTSTSLSSATHTIIVDTTAPPVPIAVSPLTTTITTSTNPIVFKWDITAATSRFDSTTSCQLQISTDPTFSVIDSTAKDTTMLVTASPMVYNFYSKTQTLGTIYYWHVRGIDLAGNKSNYFTPLSIKRN